MTRARGGCSASSGWIPTALERWSTLSPGERKRWQIGAALAREPDVLLLDEPTNHLDAEAREWLVSALRRFRGVGVLVSHDRELLEALTTSTLRVHAGHGAPVARRLLGRARGLGGRAGGAPGHPAAGAGRTPPAPAAARQTRREQEAASAARNAGAG